MIDFRKELAKFDFMAVETDFASNYNETAQMMAVFNSTLKRIGKEMSHTNIQLEEVLAQYMEDSQKDSQVAELKKALTDREEEKHSLVWGLIAILDQLEDIYRYALKNENSSWVRQMQLLWNNTAASLLLQGINRIEGENTRFDARIHSVRQVNEDKNLPNGIIIEVLRCGYIYQARLLRKAQVTVNKINGGNESSE